MALLSGTRLGPYEIAGPLGAGGMGEVYRAHDTRLGRDVAIKTLPDAFSSDPDRLARFEREAKVLASLNHPNVAGIYGVEDVDGHRYLALEYVEGETLAARLARGALPLEEAIEICIQIAAGMEAAHESGIIHRDLKPGNVMITPGDVVKVVDFGLAKGKVAEPGAGSEDSPVALDSPVTPSAPTVTDSPALPHSPAVGTPATLPGVILGTAAYLSPEQARGKVVDRRTDIWSLGCVLYECLTGRRAFEGETVSDVIASILSREVEWGRLPRGTPAAIRALLRRCLEKDPRKRLRDIGDARLALEEIREGKGPAAEPTASHPLLSMRVIAFGVALALVCTAAGIALWNAFGPGHGAAPASRSVRRVSIAYPPELQLFGGHASPDGRFLFTVGAPRTRSGEQPAQRRMYRRRLDGDRFEPVDGTERVLYWTYSQDGRWLYALVQYSERTTERRLVRAPIDGGAPPGTVVDWDPSWSVNYTVLNSGELLAETTGETGYVRIPPGGGVPSAPIKFDAPGFTGTFSILDPLPGDRGVLVGTTSRERDGFHTGTGVLDPGTGKVKLLFRDGSSAQYAATGHLVFTRGSTLLAVPFDLKRLEVRGDPTVVADGLRTSQQGLDAGFSISRDGTLTYLPGGVVGERRRLMVVDRQGRVSDWSRERAFYEPRLYVDPAGTRVAFGLANARGLNEIWISERGRPTARRLVSVPGVDPQGMAWSPDSRQIAYFGLGTDEVNGVYLQSLDRGEPRKICAEIPPAFYSQLSWSPDGRMLLASRILTLSIEAEIVRVPVPAANSLSSPVRIYAQGGSLVGVASLSPDGRWIAFASNETGRFEVYVAPYGADGTMGEPLMVSSGGGFDPRWSRNGREVFYQSAWQGDRVTDLQVMSVALQFQPALSAAEPVAHWNLAQLRMVPDSYDILPDNQMVAIQKGEEEDEVTRAEVVLNFFEELKQKMRAAGSR